MNSDVKSITTAGKRIRYLGSAKSGVGAARAMHMTSVALVPLTIAFVWIVLGLVGKDYAAVRTTLAAPLRAILMLLFVGTGIWHMKLGMQVIIDDYVHAHHLKDWALIANAFFSAVLGLACLYALLKIGLAPQALVFSKFGNSTF